MREPTMLSQSGTTYEGSALRAALARRPGVDPLSNASFEGEPHLVVNRALREAIERRREQRRVAATAAAAAPAPVAPAPPPRAPRVRRRRRGGSATSRRAAAPQRRGGNASTGEDDFLEEAATRAAAERCQRTTRRVFGVGACVAVLAVVALWRTGSPVGGPRRRASRASGKIDGKTKMFTDRQGPGVASGWKDEMPPGAIRPIARGYPQNPSVERMAALTHDTERATEVSEMAIGSRKQRPAPEGFDLPDAAHLHEASVMSDAETITVGDVA